MATKKKRKRRKKSVSIASLRKLARRGWSAIEQGDTTKGRKLLKQYDSDFLCFMKKA